MPVSISKDKDSMSLKIPIKSYVGKEDVIALAKTLEKISHELNPGSLSNMTGYGEPLERIIKTITDKYFKNCTIPDLCIHMSLSEVNSKLCIYMNHDTSNTNWSKEIKPIIDRKAINHKKIIGSSLSLLTAFLFAESVYFISALVFKSDTFFILAGAGVTTGAILHFLPHKDYHLSYPTLISSS